MTDDLHLPIKQDLIFPGLAEALIEKEIEKKVNSVSCYNDSLWICTLARVLVLLCLMVTFP